jgi:alkyl hydroperoxide reductase subunit AhpF
MPLLDEPVAAEARRVLAGLRAPVRMDCFALPGCHPCVHVLDLATELAELSPLLRVHARDLHADRAEAAHLGVPRVPALVLGRVGDDRAPVRYYGLPAGHEFGALLRILLAVSTGQGAPGADAAAAAAITRPAQLKVFVVADCTRCPEMAWVAASLAVASPLVTTEIILADEFPDLIERYAVGQVPKIVVNDRAEVLDVVPAAELIAKIAAAPPA